MNQAPELEVVDLGDAKEQTKGWTNRPETEDGMEFPKRYAS
jgi:hypothetical protein